MYLGLFSSFKLFRLPAATPEKTRGRSLLQFEIVVSSYGSAWETLRIPYQPLIIRHLSVNTFAE